MKAKLIWLVAAVAAGFSASADVLHWQVNSDAVTDAAWTTAGVAIYDSVISDHASAASSASGYLLSQTGTSSATTQIERQAFDNSGYVAATRASFNDPSNPATPTIVEGIANNTSYSGKLFYIELYDSNNNIVARSNDYLSFDDSGHLVSSNTSAAVSDFLSTSAFMENATIWNGGTFTVVPEPTSGLMMLLGAAVLGLRRKRRV